MNRYLTTMFVVSLYGGMAIAQTTTDPRSTAASQPAPPAQKQPHKPGEILDSGSGRITDAPAAPPAAPPAAKTTSALAGQKVERFEAVGNTSVASDTIRVYLGVVPGDPYDPAALQRNFLNLWQTGLFDDIRLEADRGDTGVIVRAVVKERPRIGSVEYRGNKELTTAKITEALEKDKIDLHIGNTTEQTLVKRAAESIKHAYTEGGFEGVTVDTMTENMAQPGEQKIVFIINEGVKARISGIQFTGNAHFSNRRLLHVMKDVKKSSLISRLRKKDLYIPSKLDEDLERVKNYYQDFGYQNVSFGDPQIVTTRTGKKPRVKLVIPIKEGEIHTFGDVTVSGNTVFTSDQIIGAWPIKKGETIRRKPIQARADAFGEGYRSRGYIYAYVNPEYVMKDNNVVDVHMVVYEGDQFRLGRLEFQGNTTTKDKVLRREIFIDEGQIMDMEIFKQSIYKLGQLGYFKVTENPDFKVNPETKTVDINLKGVEEGKNDVQFGGGYSEGGGFFVQAQFSTRNLLGEGESLGLSFQRGNRQNLFSLSYSDPWFMDTPNSFGFSVFNRNTRYPASVGLDAQGRGGTVAYGYRLHRFDSISLLYGLEHVREHRESNIAPDANGNVPVSEISDVTFVTSTIGPSYRYDSRDNPYDTTRGMKLAVGLGFSGGPLGGTVHLFKPTLNLTKFFHLSRRTSFSTNLELGYIKALDKDCSNTYEEYSNTRINFCVPTSERFLVGGEYSVRGFEQGQLGPHESVLGILQAVGGTKYHLLNLEYVIKINDPLRLVFFADGGFSYASTEAWDLTKTRFSVGSELRVFLPVFQFPLRFIYSFNPQKKPDDKFTGFTFTIGNTF
jgi:outer membrane protein insertion porin family